VLYFDRASTLYKNFSVIRRKRSETTTIFQKLKANPSWRGVFIMLLLDANIDRTAALTIAATFAAGGFFLIGLGFLSALGAGRGIDRTLQEGRGGLGLNLGNRSGNGVLGLGRGKNRNWHWSDLHEDPPGSTAAIILQFLHVRNEEMVNRFGVNLILKKSLQMSPLARFFEGRVRP
jgi:hypothetical protein